MVKRLIFPIIVFAICGSPIGREAGNFVHDSLRDPASYRTSDAHANTDRGIRVVTLSPDFPIDDLRRDGYRVDVGTQADDEPDPKVRDEIFREVGAWPYARKLDHLDRDFLFLRAREYTAARFGARYPILASGVRARLQKIAKGRLWAR